MAKQIVQESKKAVAQGEAGRGDWSRDLMGSFGSFRREMDQLFHRFFDRDVMHEMSMPLAPWVESRDLGRMYMMPDVDVYEGDKAYQFTVELPGMNKKEVDLSIENGVLSIKGEKRSAFEKEDEGRRISERRYGKFLRSFTMPSNVDESRIDATFADGVLTVSVPKTSETKHKSKKISID